MRVLICSFFLAAISLGSPTDARSQQPVAAPPAILQTIQQDKEGTQVLFSNIQTIALALKKTVIVETVPTRTNLIAAAKVRLGSDPQESLRQVANAMGYSLEEHQGVVVLFKTAPSLSDLPTVTLPEAQLILRQLHLLIAGTGATTRSASDTIAVRSDKLIAALKTIDPASLRTGIPNRSLSSAQKEACQSVLYSAVYGGSTDVLDRIQEDLDAALDASTNYSDHLMTSASSTLSFGYRYANTSSVLRAHSLNDPNARYIHNGNLYTPLLGYLRSSFRPDDVRSWMESTRPDVSSRREVALKKYLQSAQAPSAVTTLKEVTDRLTTSNEKLTVAAPFATKSLWIFGVGKSDAVATINAIAALTGLRVVHQTDNKTGTSVRYLAPAAFPAAGTLSSNVKVLFPLNVVRYVTAPSQESNGAEKPSVTSPLLQPKSARSFPQEEAQVKATLLATQRRIEVVKYLRTLLEPLFTDSVTGEVEAKQLPKEAQEVLGLLALLDALDAMQPIIQKPVPEVLSKFDDLFISAQTVYGDDNTPVRGPDGLYRYQIIIGERTAEGKVSASAVLKVAIPKPLD